jgi:hypothetical protein
MSTLKSFPFSEGVTPLKDVRNSSTGLTLVIGEVGGHKSTRRQDSNAAVLFVKFWDLTSELLRVLKPSVVVSPAMCASFDCIELASFLSQNNFAGQYRASIDCLPNPHIILKEVRQQNPDLDFDISSQGHNISQI